MKPTPTFLQEFVVLPLINEVQKSVGQIVQDIIKFLNDHPGQRFVAVIACYGFTDETFVETEWIQRARSRWCKAILTRRDLNWKLSELRAKSIVNLVVDEIKCNEEFIPNPELVSWRMEKNQKVEFNQLERLQKRHLLLLPVKNRTKD